MPLDRAHVTVASRVMLPVYAVVSGYIGLCYILSPDARLRGASLAVARMLLPMPVWGLLALLLSASVVLAILTRSRSLAVGSLCMGAGAYFVWGCFYAISIWIDPSASVVSPIWPLLASAAHIASALSLSWGET
jgi:hypothetical protein